MKNDSKHSVAAPLGTPVVADSSAYLVEVFNKKGIFDSLANTIQHDINDLGINTVKEVKVKYLYKIKGKLGLSQIKSISNNLLADPVTQVYTFSASTVKKLKTQDLTPIEVWYKPGVTDAVGDSVRIGIQDLGIKGTKSVSTGHKYIITGRINKKIIDRIVKKLLVNEVVHQYRIY